MGPLLTGDQQRTLAQGIREGDPRAEEAFVRLFGERIRIMIAARLRDKEIARELAQDVMLVTWRGIRDGRLRDPERLGAFVHGPAHNILNNHVRAHAGDPPVAPLSEDAENVASLAGSVEDDERRAIVASALGTLSSEDRQVLIMTLVKGMQPRDIASALGLNVEVVRTRKSRAVKRVMEAVARLSRMPSKGYYSK